MTKQHPFDQAIALQPHADGSFEGSTHPGYANFVGPFGGTTAAQMLNAVLQHPQRLGDPLSLTVNYCAGVADGAFTLHPRAVRTNRSTQHWTIEMVQGDAVVTTASVVTAVRRTTWGADDVHMPAVSPPLEVSKAATSPPSEFIHRYELRTITGPLPAQWDDEEADSLTRLWVRDHPVRALDFPALAALADIFYPRVYIRRRTFSPAGTVSLTTYFHASADDLAQAGLGFLLAEARGQVYRNGFFDQTAQLWSEAGVPLASSHQVVYFKQ